ADDSVKLKILEELSSDSISAGSVYNILIASLGSSNSAIAAAAADILVRHGDYSGCSIGQLLNIYQSAGDSERRTWNIAVLACDSKDETTREVALDRLERAIVNKKDEYSGLEGYKYELQSRLRANADVANFL